MVDPEKHPMVKIYGNSSLSERLNAFQKKTDEQVKNQGRTQAPSSCGGGADSPGQSKPNLSDPTYGRPIAGSKTDKRGKAAAAHIGKEVQQLCRLIQEYGQGQEDGTVEITFKELFDMYQVISNKVVGVLLRARKHGLVHFEGEMLFQRRDDEVVITLLVDPDYIVSSEESTACIKGSS